MKDHDVQLRSRITGLSVERLQRMDKARDDAYAEVRAIIERGEYRVIPRDSSARTLSIVNLDGKPLAIAYV